MSNMARHRALIESQATIAQIEEFRESRQTEDARHDLDLKNEDLRRKHVVSNWLKAPDIESDQYEYCKVRASYPDTGRWLLCIEIFKHWFHPQFPAIPPLLWLCGMPGAGQSYLDAFFPCLLTLLQAKRSLLL